MLIWTGNNFIYYFHVFIIYSLLYIFKTTLQIFIFHFFFMTIRVKCFGAHFPSSFICRWISSLILTEIPYSIFNVYKFNCKSLIFIFYRIIYFISLFYYWKFKSYNKNKKTRITQKKTLIVCGIITFFINPYFLIILLFLE